MRLGGLGLIDPTATSDHNFQASEKMTSPLVNIILSQDQNKDVDDSEIDTLKKEIRKGNHQRSVEQANNAYCHLSPQLKRQVDLAKEHGASSWLSVLPLSDQGFHLNKGEFIDVLCLRYGWTISNIHRHCNCGNNFSTDHAMIFHMGGFPTLRHNEIRDMTASLLTEVCSNVATEPYLQPLSGENLRLASAWPLLMSMMVPDLMYVPEASGLFVRMLSLMSGCFILMLPATNQENSQQYTRDMKMRRNESMVSEFWTLSMECSPHLFCP